MATQAVKDNIAYLTQGLANGIIGNGQRLTYVKAEIHIYMPKANVTPALKIDWISKLSTAYPNIKFEINTLENFIK